MKIHCRVCGKTLDEHREYSNDCLFDPIGLPDECICDPLTWSMHSGDAPPICGKFKEMSPDRRQYCKICGHEHYCHTKKVDDYIL